MFRKLALIFLIWSMAAAAHGHGLLISNVRLEIDQQQDCDTGCVAQDTGWITFDIAWQDSWRGLLAPTGDHGARLESRDAVWLFVKYRLLNNGQAGRWRHARIEAKRPQPADFVVDGTPDQLGVFIYQQAPGPCLLEQRGRNGCRRDVDFQNISVRWLPEAGDTLHGKVVDLWLHGIEMVYVPAGPFHLGEPGCGQNVAAARDARCFFPTDSAQSSFLIDSEEPVAICSAESPGLCHLSSAGRWATTTEISQRFPKGVAAFYAMKYELDQGQYADFVNSLPRAARTLRFSHGAQDSYRYAVTWVRHGDEPLRVARRPDRAHNWVSWADTAAYLDWAALRPMTELELEKLARGIDPPEPGEYAWGSTWLAPAKVIVGNEERTITVNGNSHIGEHYLVGGDEGHGPLPGHAFARPTSDFIEAIEPPSRQRFDLDGRPMDVGPSEREREGRSYFGAMHLTGNLWEFVISLGSEQGRAFEGGHGDGELEYQDCTPEQQDCGAHANVADWPGRDGRGVGFRGGAWYTPSSRGRVVDRHFMDLIYQDRSHDTGIRGVRSVNPRPGRSSQTDPDSSVDLELSEGSESELSLTSAEGEKKRGWCRKLLGLKAKG